MRTKRTIQNDRLRIPNIFFSAAGGGIAASLATVSCFPFSAP